MTDRWYQAGVIYETHVRAFYDSDGDGIGDFRGLTEKLDYLQDLGVTGVWLLPFYPSPLRDDGYDIGDYTAIHPSYGTMRDFRRFMREAHRRNLRVITELVINHTSDQHRWFQRARRSPAGSRWRNFYVWSETPDRYRDARIIFSDTETSNWAWDPVAQAYYWHRFFSHQPDLNYDNPDVHRAVFRVLDYWLEMGVDGLRLDAVPYLYEREGTMCENLPETHEFLKRLRARIDERYDGRMLLAEANQWPEDAVTYFGKGDECHMCFHFPLMPRLFMAVRAENRFPIIDILDQTPPIPEGCQWAIFLRNHDELTLEMVTDEERDYMYRVYAQDRQARINLGIRRRLAPLLGNNRREIELLNALLFSLPGTPVIYYGDEIGMGDNIYLGDRNGVRTPMQWSGDRNAGFSRANPQKLYLPVITDPEYHYEAVNVEAQHGNPNSLYWWMKRMIAQRKRLRVLSDGDLEFLHPDNPRVLAYLRRRSPEHLLVVANLSRHVQSCQLDLSEFEGVTPVEVFGHTPFPPVGRLPYLLTLGPHSFLWFQLDTSRESIEIVSRDRLPTLRMRNQPADLFKGRSRTALEEVLSADLPQRRWFGAKANTIQHLEVERAVPLPGNDHLFLVVARVEYVDGHPDRYLLPLAVRFDEDGRRMLTEGHPGVLAAVRGADDEEGALIDAAFDEEFGHRLLSMVLGRRRISADGSEVRGVPFSGLRAARGPASEELASHVLGAEQSNTSIAYGQRLILKLFRRLDEGVNPDLEIGRFLTEVARFPNVPPYLGALEMTRPKGVPITLAVLQGYVPNLGDAWQHTLDALGRFYEAALSLPEESRAGLPSPGSHPLALVGTDLPEVMADLLAGYLADATLLGRRTAEMHLALCSSRDHPDFAPEPISTLYQRSLYQSMRTSARNALRLLRRSVKRLEGEAAELAERVAGLEDMILERLSAVHREKIVVDRIRVHGDYHLGQVLYTGRDFMIIDFEGEPARPLSERRLKRVALRDVAGMVRSFHYAAYAGLRELRERGDVPMVDGEGEAEPYAELWFEWVTAAFLTAYLQVAAGTPILPEADGHLEALLDAYLLDKATYELAYELNNRPDWVGIALRGILRHLGV